MRSEFPSQANWRLPPKQKTRKDQKKTRKKEREREKENKNKKRKKEKKKREREREEEQEEKKNQKPKTKTRKRTLSMRLISRDFCPAAVSDPSQSATAAVDYVTMHRLSEPSQTGVQNRCTTVPTAKDRPPLP